MWWIDGANVQVSPVQVAITGASGAPLAFQTVVAELTDCAACTSLATAGASISGEREVTDGAGTATYNHLLFLSGAHKLNWVCVVCVRSEV